MHRIFNLPVQKDGKYQYVEQTHDRDKEMGRRMYQTKLIIVDEISMVSNVTMMFAHQRLMGMLKKSDDSAFAGLNVLVLGDLLQLPPVDRAKMGYCFEKIRTDQWRAAFPGSVVRPPDGSVWKRFHYTELTENMRQKGDKMYADLLNDLRVGKVKEWEETLQKRVWVDPEGETGAVADVKLMRKLKAEGKTPVCLVPKVRQALELNVAMLAAESIKVKFVHAKDTRPTKGRGRKAPAKGVKDADMSKGYDGLMKYLSDNTKVEKKKTGNLAEVLPLGVGARVMLTKNLSVENDLFNGAMGTVSGFVQSSKTPNEIVGVKVKFDLNPEKEELIKREMASWEPSPSITVTREQFPLELAYAITVHKSQGLSLDCVVAHLGADVFETGQAYVALSRARSLEGLHLLSFEPSGVRYDEACVKEYSRQRALCTHLGPLEAEPQKPRKRRAVKVRKSMEELMADVSPTKPPPSKKARVAEAGEEMNEDEVLEALLDEEETEESVPARQERGLAFVPLRNVHPERTGAVENICFVNAAVQALLGCEAIQEWVEKEDVGLGVRGEVLRQELGELLQAMRAGDKSAKDARVIREIVATHSRSLESEDYGDLEQHCSADFVLTLMDVCGEPLKELFGMERRTMAKCGKRRCSAQEYEMAKKTDTEWRLYLGKGRGKVKLAKLIEEDSIETRTKRCAVCCPDRWVTDKKGVQREVEGCKHELKTTVRALEGQKVMMIRVSPFFWQVGVGGKRSERKLTGLDPDSVELGGVKWRVMGGVRHTGGSANSGHYEAYARLGQKWRHMSDERSWEESELPVSELYYMLLERC